MANSRLKILQKISQSVPAGLPTDNQADINTVSGTPPAFIAADMYPSLRIGFQNQNVPWINRLGTLLNTAMYYSSSGKVHMQWMRGVNFTFGTDQIPSTDLKNLMNFSKLVYNQMFSNMGQAYQQALKPEQIAEKKRILLTSQPYMNLSSTNPTGQMATKIGGNIKSLINDLLLQIR